VRQLPLGVRLRPASTLASFAPGENAAVLAAIERRALAAGGAPLWLWGSAGTGRTHLLQAACARAARSGRSSGYLPLAEHWIAADQLAGLDALDLLCLDDLDAVAGQAAWESSLFRLLVAAAEHGAALLIAASSAPAAVRFALADLASRLRASEVWQLRPLPARAQGAALTERARLLGLELPDETREYLQRRLPREFATLCSVLDTLDDAALAAQRRLTVPFVRELLTRAEGPAETPPGGAPS
jgi:DnaA family protein